MARKATTVAEKEQATKKIGTVAMPDEVKKMVDAATKEMTEAATTSRLPHEIKHDELVRIETAYCQALNDGVTDPDEIKKHKKAVKDALGAYNRELAHYWYREWKKQGDPVKKAILKRYVPGAIKVNMVRDENTQFFYPEETSKGVNMKISLTDMQQTIGDGVFSNPKWADACNHLAFLYANRTFNYLNIHDPFEYRIPATAKAFQFDPAIHGSVYSNKFFLSALQTTFDAIIMDPDADGQNRFHVLRKYDVNGVEYSPQWEYVVDCFTSQGKRAGDVLIGNISKFEELVTDAMYMCAIEGDFTLSERK